LLFTHFLKLLPPSGIHSRAGRSQPELLIFIVLIAVAVNLPGQVALKSAARILASQLGYHVRL
jgi:hypothetical protein